MMGRRPKRKAEIDHDGLSLLPGPLRRRELMNYIVAVIFAATAPVPRERLAAVIPDEFNLDQLLAEAAEELRAWPFEIVRVAGGYQIRTRPEYGPVIRGSGVSTRGAVKLGRKEHLVLAIIAYDQPITRKEVSEKIGAECDVAIAALRDAELITYGPRRRTPGAPPTYVTTKKFEVELSLNGLNDLPSIEEIELLRDRRPAPETLGDSLSEIEPDDDVDVVDDGGPSPLRSDAASREGEEEAVGGGRQAEAL
jgi:segregation and condensation protein B